MRISDWSSDVCSSDLAVVGREVRPVHVLQGADVVHHEGLRCAPLLVAVAAGRPADIAPVRHHVEFERVPRRRHRGIAGAADFMPVLQAERMAEFRSEEHTSELQSLMRISYAVFCLKKKQHTTTTTQE